MSSDLLNSSSSSTRNNVGGNRTNRVCVYCRLAPSKESEALCLSALDAEARSIELQRDSHPVRQYQFDGIFSPKSSTQSDVFDVVAKDLVDDVLSGWNATCLSYGQTGTGKTYTMLGPALAGLVDGNSSSSSSTTSSSMSSSSLSSATSNLPSISIAAETSGIIPRAVSRIFDQLATSTDKSTFVVQASYVQLYCEAVYDLLQGYAPSNAITGDSSISAFMSPGGINSSSVGAFSSSSSLQIREDPETGVFVEGATWVSVSDAAQCLAVLASGSRNRAVAATLMNAQSSRSHAIFMLRVERRIPATNAPSANAITRTSTPKSAAALVARVQKGTLFLVDLAGSERQSRSGVAGVHLDEMRAINLSLSALGNCISALASRGDSSRTSSSSSSSSSSVHVPYRDSKLTRLLQDSLGGNARTSLVITVSQAAHSALETQSTLEFGSRAAKVTVHAVRNEVVDYRALYMALKLSGGSNNQALNDRDSTAKRSSSNPDGYILIREDELSRLKEREAALSEEVAALRAIADSNGGQELTDSIIRSRAPSPSSVRSVEDNGNMKQVPRAPTPSSSSLPATEARTVNNNIKNDDEDNDDVDTSANSIPPLHSKKSTVTIGTSPMPQPSMTNASVNASGTSGGSPNNVSSSSNKGNPPGSIVLTAQAQEVMSRQLARLKAELGLAKSDLDKSQDSLLSAVREQRKLKERVKEAEKELTVRVSSLLEELTEARSRAEEAEEKAKIAEDEAEVARKELRSSISGGGGGGAVHAARAGAVSEVTRLYEASISGLQKRVSKVEERCQAQANLVQELAHRLRVRERQVQVQKLQAKRAQEALWRSQGGKGDEEEVEGGMEDIEADISQDSISAIVVDPSKSAAVLPVGSAASAVAAALRNQRPMSEGSGVRAMGHKSRSSSLLEQHSHAISTAAEREGGFLQQASTSTVKPSSSSSSSSSSSLQLKPMMMTMMGGVGSLAQSQPAPVPRLSSASLAASNAALFGLGNSRPSTGSGKRF
jgi:hypothetical protein